MEERNDRKARYTIIDGKKVYLNAEQQKAHDAFINAARNYARKTHSCSQPNYHLCFGDCENCRWHTQGIVLSTDDEAFVEGSCRGQNGIRKEAAQYTARSAEDVSMAKMSLEAIFDYAAKAETNGAEILRLRFEKPEKPLSGHKIAAQLGMAPSTVNDILRRLLSHIREHRDEFI